MTRVLVDQKMRDKLKNLGEAVELCDEDGRVLGFFSPLIFKPDPAEYEGTEVPHTQEETQQLLRVRTGRPLSDILHDLDSRA